MITLQVRLYASLRKYQPGLGHGESLQVQLPEGSRIADLLDRLGVPKNETKQVFVNGRLQVSDYVLKDGEEVGIFPPIAGGKGSPLTHALPSLPTLERGTPQWSPGAGPRPA